MEQKKAEEAAKKIKEKERNPFANETYETEFENGSKYDKYILMYFYIMFLRCFLYHEMSYLTFCHQIYWVWVVSTVFELLHYHFEYIRCRMCFVFLESKPLVECYSSSVVPNYMQFCFFLLTVTYEECLLEE